MNSFEKWAYDNQTGKGSNYQLAKYAYLAGMEECERIAKEKSVCYEEDKGSYPPFEAYQINLERLDAAKHSALDVSSKINKAIKAIKGEEEVQGE